MLKSGTVTSALTSGDLASHYNLQHSESYFGDFSVLSTNADTKLQKH